MRVQTWHIVRGPHDKVVSGLYTDEEAAEEKASDLSERKPFDYSAEPAGRVEESRLA